MGHAGSAARGPACPARCVRAPAAGSPPLGAPSGAEVRAPSLKLASFPGIRPNWDLFPQRSSTPRPHSACPELRFSVSAEQCRGLEATWAPPPGSPPDNVWGLMAQGLGDFTQHRSKGPVAHVWSSLPRGRGPHCGPLAPAHPCHSPEALLGQTRAGKGPHLVRHTQTHGQLKAASTPEKGHQPKAPGEQMAHLNPSRPPNPHQPPSPRRCSPLLDSTDGGCCDTHTLVLASGPDAPPWQPGCAKRTVTQPEKCLQHRLLLLASSLEVSRDRRSESQRTNIETEALPSDLPTSTYLAQGGGLPIFSPEPCSSCGGHCLRAGLEPQITNRNSSYRFVSGATRRRMSARH